MKDMIFVFRLLRSGLRVPIFLVGIPDSDEPRMRSKGHWNGLTCRRLSTINIPSAQKRPELSQLVYSEGRCTTHTQSAH